MSQHDKVAVALPYEGQLIQALVWNGRPAFCAAEVDAALGLDGAAGKHLQMLPCYRRGADFDLVNRDLILPHMAEGITWPQEALVCIVYESGLYGISAEAKSESRLPFLSFITTQLLPELRAEDHRELYDDLSGVKLELIREAGRGNRWAMYALHARGFQPLGGNPVPSGPEAPPIEAEPVNAAGANGHGAMDETERAFRHGAAEYDAKGMHAERPEVAHG
jgi:hypothetical protein